MLSAATTVGTTGGGLPAAAALASMCELDAQMDGGNFIPMLGGFNSPKVSSSAKPFDWVTLVDGGLHGSAEDASSAIDSMAELLWVDSHTLVGLTLDAARHEQGPHYTGNQLQPFQIARACCVQAIQRWKNCLCETGSTASHDSLGWSSTQTGNIIEHLSADCLRGLRFSVEQAAPSETTRPTTNPWRNRASHIEETARLQLERDMRLWRQWMAEHIRPSYVSWTLLQKIVLRIVERMLACASWKDEKIRAMVHDAESGSESFSATECELIRRYIETLAGKLMQQLQLAQPQVDSFANTMKTWLGSLQAEHNMRDGSMGVDMSNPHVPVGWRHMLQRVHSVLDSTMHRFVVGRCFNSLTGDNSGQDCMAGLMSLEQLLRLSDDLVNRFMRDAGIKAPQKSLGDAESAGRSIVLQEVSSMVPTAAQRGGCLYRLLAVTPSQQNDLKPRMQQLDMSESCTIVPAQYGEEPVVVCDANDLNLSSMIASIWRPNSETFKLAERLHTRSDVVWPSIDALLNNPTAAPVA
jgi:hypothetical protein